MQINSDQLMNDLLDRFAATLTPEDSEVLADVCDYVEWQAGRCDVFAPSAADDVDLRTYLLHLRTSSGKVDRATLLNKLTSLKRFYEWAQAEGIIDATPFVGFDWQLLSRDQIARRQESLADPQEREIFRLQALNRLAQALNSSADVQSALDATLETLVEVMGLRTAWVSVVTDVGLAPSDGKGSSASGFTLAAACGLPPGLEQDDRFYLRRSPQCRCQSLLRRGRLTHAVNIVECSRLQDAASVAGDTQGLLYHATVPIISQGRPLGVLNIATDEWQLLTDADLQLLSAAGAQVAIALERARLYDLAQAQSLRLKRELEMARSVQASLLPSRLPQIPGFDLAADWHSASEVAGDFYDIFSLGDGLWGLLIADVAGKGAPAALSMAMTSSLIRATATHALGPAEVLMQVNRALTAQSSIEMFVTVFYAILDPTAHTLTYTVAGHDRPIVRRNSPASNTEQLLGGGLPIGLFNEVSLADTTISLAPGDVLVAYTDGLTEVFNVDREMFGRERFTQLVRDLPAVSAQGLLDAILTQVKTFAGEAPQSDDMTLLVMCCEPSDDQAAVGGEGARAVPTADLHAAAAVGDQRKASGPLCVAAELENLAVIRDFVQESAPALNVEPDVISDLLLAVDEAVTNAIVHGFQGRQGTIEIELAREALDVIVRIRDNAPPFDPTSAPWPDLTQPLEKRPLGGLGIFLMRRYMDEITHRITPQGGNELTMKKRTANGRTKQ
jgi:serine phosphatase RsbU (regulator of sigma subunit)/anti-sigma regulatory factor (Ser/Thr protein kinase)